MSTLRGWKQKLAAVSRLWEKGKYDAALDAVEALLREWPGNGHLHGLWAGLVQLQEDPAHSLEDVRHALDRAADLDPTSAAAEIERGHFLDAVEDDPRSAARAFGDAAALARAQLVEALIGQARALAQLGKKLDARRCLLEVLRHVESGSNGKGHKTGNGVPAAGRVSPELEELLGEVFLGRTA
jgi:tetratricopeptide (TPR) repeat protein